MIIVAIPVCNERETIVGCLKSIAEQVDVRRSSLGILLFLNNCTDGTGDVVDAWTPTSPCPVRTVSCHSNAASAGWARREAMNAAAYWLEEIDARDGLLLTTDADSRVPEDWVALNRAALSAGADAVAGRIAFDPVDVAKLPDRLRNRQALERQYDTLLAEIEARLAPAAGDPWPCHRTKSGASIAVSLQAYRRVGGIPLMNSGEDHAFIDLIRAQGLIVRHAPEIVVTTSGRLDGRARGGSADTLRRRSIDAEKPCDARLERATSFTLRLLFRRFAGHGLVGSQRFRFRPLQPNELPFQIDRARSVLKLIRWLEARRAGTLLCDSASPPQDPKQLPIP